MITVVFACVLALGVFIVIWRVVTNSAVRLFGKTAAMTFTPPDYKPALDENGELRYDSERNLVQVPTGEFVQFEPRHERYMKVAEVVTALASASLVFVPNSRPNTYPHSCAFALVLLGFSALYSISFMALLTYFYEGFLYQRNSYSPSKYGFVTALGFGGFICFAVAYLWLAVRVGWAVMYASTTAGTT